jgi:protein MpaA
MIFRYAIVVAMAACLFPNQASASDRGERIGTSTDGRKLIAVVQGDDDAPLRALVVGEIHGNEAAGQAVIRRLRKTSPPDGVQLWTVLTVNPDGHHADTRQNANGVDLNRNFPWKWRAIGAPWDTYFPGANASSEAETRAVTDLIDRIDPQLTIWYHQHMNIVVKPKGNARRSARRYAKAVGMKLKSLAFLPGTAVGWHNSRDDQSHGFVVELPAGELSKRSVRRHVRAVRTVLRSRAGALAGVTS